MLPLSVQLVTYLVLQCMYNNIVGKYVHVLNIHPGASFIPQIHVKPPSLHTTPPHMSSLKDYRIEQRVGFSPSFPAHWFVYEEIRISKTFHLGLTLSLYFPYQNVWRSHLLEGLIDQWYLRLLSGMYPSSSQYFLPVLLSSSYASFG